MYPATTSTPRRLAAWSGLEHRIGFACAGSVAKKILRCPRLVSSVIGDLVFLNCLEDEVWIDASVNASHCIA